MSLVAPLRFPRPSWLKDRPLRAAPRSDEEAEAEDEAEAEGEAEGGREGGRGVNASYTD